MLDSIAAALTWDRILFVWIMGVTAVYGVVGWGIDIDLRDYYKSESDRKWRRLPVTDLFRPKLFTPEGNIERKRSVKALGYGVGIVTILALYLLLVGALLS